MRRKIICQLLCLLLVPGAVEMIFAQGTAFTYQGQLNDGGSPASGDYDLAFSLYLTNQTGVVVAGPVTNTAVPVSSGLFTTTLDFGPGNFTGLNYWLQIAVRTNGVGGFTNLAPRQPLLPVPYAIFADSASNLLGSLASSQLSGTLPASAFAGYTNTVTLTNGGNYLGGNGTNLVNLNATQLTGGTVADARLSPNVALLNANQTFTGSNTFTGTNNLTGVNTFTNYGNSFRGSFFGNGLVGWLVQGGTAVQAVIDTGYVLTNSQLVTVTLPTNANIGDIVRISGAGSGGWAVLQNTNQSIIGNYSGYTNSTWLPSNAGSLNWSAIACSSDGTKLVAAVNGSGNLYNSIDSGKTWVSTGSQSGQWQTVASSADGTRLVAALNGGYIYTSTNAGAASGITWVARTSSSTRNWYSLASSADGVRLVGAVNGGGIYASPDAGVTWNAQTISGGNKSWYSVASSANGSNLVAVVNAGGIWTNSGSAWSQTSALTKNWVSVASSADGAKLAAVETGGGIYTSGNSGSTWVLQTNAPSLAWASIAASTDGSKLVAVSANGGIYISINFGVTWIPQAGTANKTWSCITSSASAEALVAGATGVSTGGLFYTQATAQASTTPGISGGISGSQGSAVELQYIGNNQFMPVSSVGTIWAN